MRDWLRRVDPAFYYKEVYLLAAQAQIARYTDEAQAEARLSVLTSDRVLLAATTVVGLSAYIAVTGVGALDPRRDWPTMWAFAFLAVGVPDALPWRPRGDRGVRWRDALLGSALIVIPTLWTRAELAIAGIALAVAATLCVARVRLVLLALAAGVLFGVHVNLLIAPLVAVVAAAACVFAIRAISGASRLRPQIVTWSAFAMLLVACAYTFAFNAPVIAPRVPGEIAAIAVAYLAICMIAGRIRRAELLARPAGVISLPQSIVPLLERSHDHAVICWFT